MAGPPRFQRDVGVAAVQRSAVASRPMVHQVETGQQADARRSAGRALAEMVAEEDAVPGKRVEVGGPHDGVADGAEAIAAPLIGADEENVGFGSPDHWSPLD